MKRSVLIGRSAQTFSLSVCSSSVIYNSAEGSEASTPHLLSCTSHVHTGVHRSRDYGQSRYPRLDPVTWITPTMAQRARAFQEACRLRWRSPVQHTSTCSPGLKQADALPLPLQTGRYPRSQPALPCPRISNRNESQPYARIRHASTSSGPSRRAITVTTDDGRYDWKELSKSEKAARGTQQTFNFLLVSLGLVGTVRDSRPAG